MNLLSGLLSAGMGYLTGGPVGAAVGGLGALTAPSAPKNRTDKNAAQAAASQQRLQEIGNLLSERYKAASPGERSALTYFFNRAGLQSPGGNVPGGNYATVGGNPLFGQGLGGAMDHPGVGTGTAPGINNGQPFAAYGSRRTLPGFTPTTPTNPQTGLVGGSQGIWSSPQYQLLRQQAEEAIQHNMQGNQLAFNSTLGQRGIDRSSVQAGGQAAITAGANKSYADFARQLALSAADKQDQLVNQFNNALQPALNSAGQAGSLYSSAAGLGQSGQSLNQAQGNLQNSLLGDAMKAAANYWGLNGANATPPITDARQVVGDISAYPRTTDINSVPESEFRAQGGPILPGHEYVVGENGPEFFSSQFPGVIIPNANTPPRVPPFPGVPPLGTPSAPFTAAAPPALFQLFQHYQALTAGGF